MKISTLILAIDFITMPVIAQKTTLRKISKCTPSFRWKPEGCKHTV